MWNFADELARHGPECVPITLDEARAYCESVTRRHYENFSVASWLLPKALRPHFHSVYAWCRWADDLADETNDGTRLLAWWREELAACYEGTERHPVTIALKPTVEEFGIPQSLFLDLISAFEQDQTVKDYSSYVQLLDYCRRSANPVGRIVLHLFRCCDDTNASLSDEICTGLQLANFWQDVARDLKMGRKYLPREDRETFRYSDEDYHARRFNDAFRELLRFQVERTRSCFARGEPLLRRLPRRLALEVRLFHGGGCAILDAIERQNYDVWSCRPRLSKWRKTRLLWTSLTGIGRR
jgi:squalene synthase HpnC